MVRKMKDSGVEWIGEIPEDWEIVKLKFLTELISKGISPNYTEEKFSPVVNQATFSKGYFDYNLKYCSDELKGEGLLEKDDVLLATTGGGVLGKTFYFQEDKKYLASTDVAYLRCKSQEISKFIYYILSINYGLLNGEYAKGSTNQTHLQMDSLSNMKIPSPPENKLKEIINKGDYSTKVIDGDIAIIENQLSVLEAYKKSVVTEAVTKGLDKNAEMKDSGIEWIGEIPMHWEVMPLKYFANINMGQSVSGVDILVERQGVPFIQGCAEFTDKYPLPKYWCITPNKLAPKDSVLMSVRAPVGELNIADQEYGIGRGLCAFNSSNNQYLYYLLLSNVDGLISYSNGSTYDAVTVSTLENYRVVVAPNSEKEEIVSFLDNKTQTIDEVIAIKQNQLSLLDEYKKSLIYEYVTGKREV